MPESEDARWLAGWVARNFDKAEHQTAVEHAERILAAQPASAQAAEQLEAAERVIEAASAHIQDTDDIENLSYWESRRKFDTALAAYEKAKGNGAS